MQDQVTTSEAANRAASFPSGGRAAAHQAMSTLALPVDDVLTVIAGLVEAMVLETEALCAMNIEAQRELLPKKKLLADAFAMHSEVLRRNPGALGEASDEEMDALKELLDHLRAATEENQNRVVAAQSATRITLNAIGMSAQPLNPGPALYTRKGAMRSSVPAHAQPAPVYRDQRL